MLRVNIRQHDACVVAAEFEGEPCSVSRARLTTFGAGSQPVNTILRIRVADQGAPDVSRAAHGVDHARRQHLVEQLDQRRVHSGVWALASAPPCCPCAGRATCHMAIITG